MITFYRQGHANNSSSEHSIILVNNPEPFEADYYNYGLNFFLLSSQKEKAEYLTLSLFLQYTGFVRFQDHSFLGKMFEEEDLEKFLRTQFLKWINFNNLNYIKEYHNTKQIHNLLTDGMLDHQSVISFPFYRQEDHGLNIEFIDFWFDTVITQGYSIIGGSDCTINDEYLLDNYDSVLDEVFLIHKELKFNHKSFCVFDDKTQEFVISFKDTGSLLKITKSKKYSKKTSELLDVDPF